MVIKYISCYKHACYKHECINCRMEIKSDVYKVWKMEAEQSHADVVMVKFCVATSIDGYKEIHDKIFKGYDQGANQKTGEWKITLEKVNDGEENIDLIYQGNE